MTRAIRIGVQLALLTLLAPPAHAGFKPFSALSNGANCRITLEFPDGNFCGTNVPVDNVRSWYFGTGAFGNETLLMGQRYDFTVVAKTDDGMKVIPVQFLNPGTAKRFYIQMGAWTGKASAHGGESPFPEWLDVSP